MAAKVFPEAIPNRIRQDKRRSAEIKVFEALRVQLGKDWTVLYSCAWLGPTGPDGPSQDGETDFIVAHAEHGILLIEVKGGRIRFDGRLGQWFSIDREEVAHEIAPFEQLRRSKAALVTKLRAAPGWKDRWISLGQAVAFPDVVAAGGQLPAEAPRDVVIDGEDLKDIGARARQILAYHRGQDASGGAPGADLVNHLVRTLAPTTTLPNPLALQIAEEEQEILRLTEAQFSLLEVLKRTRRAAISGCAGAGKTLLAVEKARRMGREGMRTLLTCFSRPLAEHLSAATAGTPGLDVFSFPDLCCLHGELAGLPPAQSGEGTALLDETYPETLLDAMTSNPDSRYDAIVVDEGQDFRTLWWSAIEGCLSDTRQGILYVFFDDNQRVFREGAEIPADLPVFPIGENVRNTRAIHQTFFKLYDGDAGSKPRGPWGRTVETFEYRTQDEMARSLGTVLQRLVTVERVSSSQIVVLTPREIAESQLPAIALPAGLKLVTSPSGAKGEVLMSTVAAFKGQERQVAVVTELDERLPGDQTWRSSLCYVAFSRPRSHLVILGKPGELECLL